MRFELCITARGNARWGFSLRRACGCKGKPLSLTMDMEPVSFISLLKVGHFSVTLLIIITMKIPFPQMGNSSEKLLLRGKSQVSNKRTSFPEVMLLLGRRVKCSVKRNIRSLSIRSVFEDGLCLSLCYKESQWQRRHGGGKCPRTLWACSSGPCRECGRV